MSSSFDASSFWKRVRGALGFGERASGPAAHRVSRRERDEQYTRMLVTGLAIVAVVTVIALVAGVFYENVVKPNAVLATVGDEEITRRDYWKYYTVQLYEQADDYEEFAEQVEGQQRSQFLSFASSFRAQADDVWGTTDVSQPALAQMVEDQLYLRTAEQLDLDISDAAVQNFVRQQFAPEGAELVTPYPEPTLIPTRAAWATETAEAQSTLQAEALGTPAGATPVGGTPAATPIPATPDPEEAAAEAEESYAEYRDEVFDTARISEQAYLDMVARPQLARELVASAVGAEVPQAAEQVHARHILVSTEDLARELYERATSGASFEELARSNSIDQATAGTGGDLGWFTEDAMVEPVTEAAFSLQPGEISEPVESEFGWHIIQVVDRAEERPLTGAQYQQAQEKAVSERIAQVRADTDIDADVAVAPTPTPTPPQFDPPPDAPTPVPATPMPMDPGATPVSPGTPVATPVLEGPVLGTPLATPDPES